MMQATGAASAPSPVEVGSVTLIVRDLARVEAFYRT